MVNRVYPQIPLPLNSWAFWQSHFQINLCIAQVLGLYFCHFLNSLHSCTDWNSTQPGGTWVAQMVGCLPWAQALVSGSWYGVLCWAPSSVGSLRLHLPLPLPFLLVLSLSVKWINRPLKKKKNSTEANKNIAISMKPSWISKDLQKLRHFYHVTYYADRHILLPICNVMSVKQGRSFLLLQSYLHVAQCFALNIW